MKFTSLLFVSILFTLSSRGQAKHKFSLEINYGLNGNFFVRSYDERDPAPGIAFNKKNFIGSTGGIELRYNLSKKSSLNLGYAQSINKRELNYNNGVNAALVAFNITHNNFFYQLGYQRQISNRLKNLRVDVGIFYLRMKQQEINASPSGLFLQERNFKNNKLEEGGAFVGLQFSKKIDTKFDLGIKGKFYFLISTGSPEAIMLTPTLTYHF